MPDIKFIKNSKSSWIEDFFPRQETADLSCQDISGIVSEEVNTHIRSTDELVRGGSDGIQMNTLLL